MLVKFCFPSFWLTLWFNQTNMIGQFRVHDYGMERCAIIAQVPDYPTLVAKNQTLVARGNTSAIEVWWLDLDESGPLHANTLSWQTRPPRKQFLGHIAVEAGKTSQTSDFDCGPSNSFRAFELACPPSQDECFLDFWQDIYFKPRFGALTTIKTSRGAVLIRFPSGIYVLQQPSL